MELLRRKRQLSWVSCRLTLQLRRGLERKKEWTPSSMRFQIVVRLGRESGGTLDVVEWEIESTPFKHAVEPDDSTLSRVRKVQKFPLDL